MVSIARKNLFHDKGRLAITLLGLCAALVLALLGLGMFIGTIDESVAIVDRAGADVWVLRDGNDDVLSTSVIDAKAAEDISAMEGVKDVRRLIYTNGVVERNGEKLPVMLVGLDLEEGSSLPLKLASGDVEDAARGEAVVIDRSAELKLGALSPLDLLLVNDSEQAVVGVSEGAKWFINPFVITSLANAQKLARLRWDEVNFLLVDLEPGYDPAEIAADISGIEGLDALPAARVRKATRAYMIYESGMGMGVGIMVLIGLIVAAVIISLTIYTATMERIPEFGTLKAMGASRKDIYRIQLEQVLISVTIGYVLGLALAYVSKALVGVFTLMPIKMNAFALVFTYLVALALSVGGAFFSIRKVNRIDPAIVFRT